MCASIIVFAGACADVRLCLWCRTRQCIYLFRLIQDPFSFALFSVSSASPTPYAILPLILLNFVSQYVLVGLRKSVCGNESMSIII